MVKFPRFIEKMLSTPPKQTPEPQNPTQTPINHLSKLIKSISEGNYDLGLSELKQLKDAEIDPSTKSEVNNALTQLSISTLNLPRNESRDREVLIGSLKKSINKLSDQDCEKIKGKWEKYKNLSLFNSQSGQYQMSRILAEQAYKDPVNHKAVFANLHFAGGINPNRQDIEPPTFNQFIPYLISLLDELPTTPELEDFKQKISSAYENDLELKVAGKILLNFIPILQKSLDINSLLKNQLSKLFDTLYTKRVEILQNMSNGEKVVFLGGWTLNSMGKHAVAYVIEKNNGKYSISFVDPAVDLSNQTIDPNQRRHIDPFYSFGPIDEEKIMSLDFHKRTMMMVLGIDKCQSRDEYINTLLNTLGLTKDNKKTDAPTYSFAQQHPTKHTCQMKLIDILLKRWVDDGKGLESKKLMFQIKAKSLIRFKDVNEVRLLRQGIQEYKGRCVKFEKLIEEGKMSREEFHALLPDEDWDILNKLVAN